MTKDPFSSVILYKPVCALKVRNIFVQITNLQIIISKPPSDTLICYSIYCYVLEFVKCDLNLTVGYVVSLGPQIINTLIKHIKLFRYIYFRLLGSLYLPGVVLIVRNICIEKCLRCFIVKRLPSVSQEKFIYNSYYHHVKRFDKFMCKTVGEGENLQKINIWVQCILYITGKWQIGSRRGFP